MKKITIIGAGLVGTYLAIRLAQEGYFVEIFERRVDPQTEIKNSIESGRFINLALSIRGIHALAKINLQANVLAHAVPMFGRFLHGSQQNTVIQPYGLTNKDCIYSIARNNLNSQLLETAFTHRITIKFSHQLINVDAENQLLQLQNNITKENILHPFDVLIACDGAFSTTRQCIQNNHYVNFTQKILSHGYKELLIQSANRQFLEKNYLHIWPRKKFMLIALPNNNDSFTATLFLELKKFKQFKTIADVQNFFQTFFPDVIEAVPDIAEQFSNNFNFIGNLNSITGFPWHYRRVLLIGDAAHAMSPFFGQGMNCGLEDCDLLLACLAGNDNDWEKTFDQFDQTRKIDTDAITKLSQDNYQEMCADVIQPKFQLQKELEKILMKNYPRIFLAKYNMVTFTRMPYHQIIHLAQLQQDFFNQLLHNVNRIEDMDWRKVEEFMQKYQQAQAILATEI